MEDEEPTSRRADLSVSVRARSLQRFLIWVTLVSIGVIYLGGWVLQFEMLIRLKTNSPTMDNSTLACAAMSGCALLALNQQLPSYRMMIRAGSAIIGAISAYLLLRGLWAEGASQDVVNDRMSGATAFAFLLFAVSIVLALETSNRVRRLAFGIATFGIAATLLPLVAYVLDPGAFGQTRFWSALSPLASVILFLLFSALVLTFPSHRWLATLLSDSPGGRNARRYVPVALLGPVVLSYAGLHLMDTNLRNTGIHLSVITLIAAFAVVAVILWAAELENERHTSARRENDQLRAIIASFDSAAVFVLDQTGELRMQNQRAKEMFPASNQTADWFLKEAFFALSDRRALTGAENPVAKLMKGASNQDDLVGWRDPEGTERALNFSSIRLPAGTQAQPLIVLSVRDHTESWLLRTALSDNQRNEGVGQLAWGVAHEMANIFGIVQISAESASLEVVSPKTGRNLDAILQACRRGSDLTHKLLEMTRNAEPEPEVLDVRTVLKSISELAARVMPSFVVFDVQYPDHPCLLRCVRADLESAVLNLLANARNAITEAAQGRGKIELHVTNDDNMLKIVVADDGPGIPDALIERVRAPYFTTRQSAGGRGIGLALVDTFANRTGGTFEIDTPQGGGARAILRLPLSQETAPAEKAEPGPDDIDLRGYRILVAESDPPFRRILTDGLRATGAEVATAAVGQAALDHLRDQPAPDVLITNFKLPDGIDGHALAADLSARSPDSRVIFLSGSADTYARPSTAVEGLVLGKPVHLAELANAIDLVPPLTQE